METVNQNIQQVFGPVTVDKVEANQYKTDRHQAQLRQVVKSIYPGGRASNSHSDSLFAAEDFNFESSEYESNRVTWIDVPMGTTVEQVQAKLAENPNCKIQRFLSLNPILTEEQKNAIQTGLTDLTVDDFAERQVVINPDTNAPALYKGRKQYSAKFFVTTAKADVDTRAEELEALGGPIEETFAFVGEPSAAPVNQPA